MPTLDETHVRTESCLRCGRKITVTQNAAGSASSSPRGRRRCTLSECTPINLQDGGAGVTSHLRPATPSSGSSTRAGSPAPAFPPTTPPSSRAATWFEARSLPAWRRPTGLGPTRSW